MRSITRFPATNTAGMLVGVGVSVPVAVMDGELLVEGSAPGLRDELADPVDVAVVVPVWGLEGVPVGLAVEVGVGEGVAANAPRGTNEQER